MSGSTHSPKSSPFSPSSQSSQSSRSRPATADELGARFLFREWATGDLEAVARIARWKTVRRGAILFVHENPCEFLYLLVEGRVRLFRDLPDGRQVTLHTVGGEALIACAALFFEQTFPASARVVSKTAEVLLVRGGPFLRLLDARPDLARRMIAALAGRIAELADRIESRTAEPARVRLARWLLDQPSRPGPGGVRIVRIEGSKKDLAASLGMNSETLSRRLRALQDKRVLTVHNKEIHLLDPARLDEECQ